MADKSAVGKTGKPFKMHIDWSKVREFARAIKDPNPIYFDPELAKKEVGGIPGARHLSPDQRVLDR